MSGTRGNVNFFRKHVEMSLPCNGCLPGGELIIHMALCSDSFGCSQSLFLNVSGLLYSFQSIKSVGGLD
jgi:hypothetical protein